MARKFRNLVTKRKISRPIRHAHLWTPRNIGVTLWTPADLTTAAWYDASDATTIIESGGAVSKWADKSGNGYDVEQLTGSKQPVTGSRTQNGLNVIDYTDVSHALSKTFGATLSQPNTMLVVAAFDSASHVCIDGEDASHRFNINQSGGNFKASAGALLDSGVASDTDTHILGLHYNSVSSNYYIDGDLKATGDAGTNDLIGITLGNRYDDSNSLRGPLAEVVVVNATLSTADRQKLEGYLAHKWGLAANLPAGHPYKSSAPTK